MTRTITLETFQIYRPILMEILADIEMRLKHPESINRRPHLDYLSKTNHHDAYMVAQALDLIKDWTIAHGYTFESYRIHKPLGSDWSQLYQIMKDKINEYTPHPVMVPTTDGPVLLKLSHGRISRTKGDLHLSHDFDGQKIKILHALCNGNFVSSKKLKEYVGSNTVESLSETIRVINTVLAVKLELPKGKKIIDSKRGFGYRINPEWYRLIISS